MYFDRRSSGLGPRARRACTAAASSVQLVGPEHLTAGAGGLGAHPGLTLDVPKAARYILGIKIDSSGPSTASLADINQEEGRGRLGLFRRPTSVVPLPAGRYQLSGEELRVSCSRDANTTTAAFVRLHGPTLLTVSGQDGVFLRRYVTDGMVVRNGAVSAAALEGMHDLLLIATVGDVGSTAETISAATEDGAHRVSTAALRSHVGHLTPLPGTAPGATVTPCSLRLEIGTDGSVLSAKASGPVSLGPAIIEAVKAWTFQPFTVNGAPVRAVGLVACMVQSDGSVHSALDPDARIY